MSKNRLDFTANLGRHSHDVTAGYTSSITTGCIVPQYFDILGPGDTIKYKTHMFARFQDINTAFLGEVDLHLDYFFVPLQMLYTAFGNVFAQTNDVISSFYTSTASGVDGGDGFPFGNLMQFFAKESIYNDFTSELNPSVDSNMMKDSIRLLDALDFNPYVALYYPYSQLPDNDRFVSIYQPNGTYFSLLAYQAIYQKYFRNEEFEKFDISSFNVDQYFGSQYPDIQIRKMLTLRYVGRPNDYFTDVRFSPIATSINSLLSGQLGGYDIKGGSSSSFSNIVSSVRSFLSSDGTYYSQQDISDSLGVSPSNQNNSGGAIVLSPNDDSSLVSLNAQNIRAVFALDKYMRVYGRAGKTYDDQILAHFGVKIPHDVKHDLTHLKHYRMVLQSDPVIASADTDKSTLGSVGGQVVGQIDTDTESFKAPVHGVFMCVAYVQTHPRYFRTSSKLNALHNRIGLPIPEFDKLGAQPIYNYEFGFRNNEDGVSGLWQNRYEEFKKKYNRVSLTFDNNAVTSTITSNFFAPWVISRRPHYSSVIFQSLNILKESFFESPFALDGVMQQYYSRNWSEDYINSPHLIFQTDPILTEYACFAKKISWMSPTGEPDL